MFNKADVVNIDGKKHIILEIAIYESKRYAFLNELDVEEEPTNENKIMEIVEKGLVNISEELTYKLTPFFIDKILKDNI